MEENIDYKVLYELANIEKQKLQKKNIELTEELDKYKMLYIKKSSYGDDIGIIIEEVTKRKKN